jgi:hypothetical protein
MSSLALSVVGDPAHPTPAERAERDKPAERAIGALRKAIAGGMTSLELYREDDDLNPLRNIDGFRLLLLDLAFPANPFAK